MLDKPIKEIEVPTLKWINLRHKDLKEKSNDRIKYTVIISWFRWSNKRWSFRILCWIITMKMIYSEKKQQLKQE